MGDTGGQLTKGSELFRLHQLAFELLAFVDLVLEGLACLLESQRALFHQVFEGVHLQVGALGHFPFVDQGIGQLLDFDIIERLFQN